DMTTFGSPAQELGFQFDQEIVSVQAPVGGWAKEWMWIPGLAVFLLVVSLQQRRRSATTTPAMAT
ncbi:MAG TPA: DUF3394 domain-containing protein, partial [Modicisalibacter sp.]|nr:DUF3394 domain-containing protein [Modicisalibacter sp.]